MTSTDSSRARSRVKSLDYLRGVMALAVMVYHYVSWTVGDLGSASILGRLGIYAVSIFYILSGVSLAIVYAERLRSNADIIDFAIRRLFRIFPLFYIVVTSALLLGWASAIARGIPYDFPAYTALLNYTLTFGFIDPSAYLSTGAWSIGNEIVFYTFFPLLFLGVKRNSTRLPIAALLSVGVAGYFAFFVLSVDIPIELQWSHYINPLNQAFLFIGGAVIGTRLIPRGGLNAPMACLVLACVAAFCLWPALGDQTQLITGLTRIVLSSVCLSLVAAIYVWNPSSDSPVMKPLAFLGEGCYSIYLLHPIVATPIVFAFSRLNIGPIGAAYCTAFVVTLVLSWLSFRFIEKPMIRAGHTISTRVIGNLRTASRARYRP